LVQVSDREIIGLEKCKRCLKQPRPRRAREKYHIHSDKHRREILDLVLGGEKMSHVAARKRIAISTISRWLKECNTTGRTTSDRPKSKKQFVIPSNYHPFVLALFYDRSMTIKKVQLEIAAILKKNVSNTAILNVLKKNRLSYHVHKIAHPISFSENLKAERKAWAEDFDNRPIIHTKLIFLDECNFECEVNRKSWRRIGEKGCVPTSIYPYTTKISVCAAMTCEKVLVVNARAGHFNALSIIETLQALKQVIVNPEEYTIVLDNVGTHKTDAVKDELKSMQYIYLHKP